jgi:hypothetical protein
MHHAAMVKPRAIQAMNEANKEIHQFMYVTPFLDEVERVKI